MTSSAKRIVKIVSLSLLSLIIIVYAYFRSADLILGVKIKNVEISGEGLIELKGNAKNAVNLTLDGREIPIDENGNFDETIALYSGYNIVTLTALDKFGNTDELTYQLIN